MGLLDKAKQFLGGKDMATVAIPVIERQPADKASFPVTDAVLKGTMVITAQQACTLLATKYEVWLYLETDADPRETEFLIRSAKDSDPGVADSEGRLELPLALQPGQVVTQPWAVSGLDLAGVLARNGFPDANAAASDPRVRLVVRCIADVGGSPFDPSAEVTVRLAPV